MRDDDILFGAMPPSLERQISEIDEDIKEFAEWFGKEVLIHIEPNSINQVMIVKEEWEDVWLEARSSLRNKMNQR